MNLGKIILIVVLLFIAAILYGWIFGLENMKWLIA